MVVGWLIFEAILVETDDFIDKVVLIFNVDIETGFVVAVNELVNRLAVVVEVDELVNRLVVALEVDELAT